MKNKTKKLKQFFTRTYNKDNTVPYAWINTIYYLLEEEDIIQLRNYIKEKRFYQKNYYCKWSRSGETSKNLGVYAGMV